MHQHLKLSHTPTPPFHTPPTHPHTQPSIHTLKFVASGEKTCPQTMQNATKFVCILFATFAVQRRMGYLRVSDTGESEKSCGLVE